MIKNNYPEAYKLFEEVVVKRNGSEREKKSLDKKWRQASFDIIKLNIDELFEIEDIKIELPDYAPIFEDKYCDICGEKIMSEKAVKIDDQIMCKSCANTDYMQLDGSGLRYCKGGDCN